MGKKKEVTAEKPKEKPRPGKPILVRMPDELADALAAYLESCRPSPTATSTILVAVEDFLKGKGFYPLK